MAWFQKKRPPQKRLPEELPPGLAEYLQQASNPKEQQTKPPIIREPAKIGQMSPAIKKPAKTRTAQLKPDEARLVQAMIISLEGNPQRGAGILLQTDAIPEVTPAMARIYLTARGEYEEARRKAKDCPQDDERKASLNAEAEGTVFIRRRRDLMRATLKTWGKETFDRYFAPYNKDKPAHEQSAMNTVLSSRATDAFSILVEKR